MTVAMIDGKYIGYQLTWRENKILKWTFNFNDNSQWWSPVLTNTKNMPLNNQLREGWGIAYGQRYRSREQGRLYASDGSSNIYIIDPVSWE